MSVQDSIASQNLSEGNSRTALEMIKLQAQNMRATQAAGVAVRQQDIDQQQNFAGNALKQQTIDQAGEQNAFERYATERQLGQADRASSRSDYQTYVQGDRKIANDEQQTANQYALGKGQLELGARGQDVDIERARLQNQVANRSVDIQEGELGLKAQAAQLKQQQQQVMAEASKQGLDALAAATAPFDPAAAAQLYKVHSDISKVNAEENRFRNAEQAQVAVGLMGSAQAPEEKLNIARNAMINVGLDPEVANRYNLQQASMFLSGLGIEGKHQADKTQAQVKGLLASGADPNGPEIQALVKTLAPANQVNINNQPDNYIAKTDAKIYEDRATQMQAQADKSQQFADATRRMYEVTKGQPLSGTGAIAKLAIDNPGLATNFQEITGIPLGTETYQAYQQSLIKGALSMKSDSAVSQQEITMNQNAMGQYGTSDQAKEFTANFAKAAALRDSGRAQDYRKWVKTNKSDEGFDDRYNQFKEDKRILDDKGQINRSNIRMPDEFFNPQAKINSTNTDNASVLRRQESGQNQPQSKGLPLSDSELDRMIAEAQAKQGQ